MQSINNSCYFGGDALQCLLDQLVAGFGGEAIFGLLAGALIFVVFYVAGEGDLATPTVALILTGTVFVSMLPNNYADIGAGVVAIGLTAALWQVVQKYILSPTTQ
jgi:hypothetical protein